MTGSGSDAKVAVITGASAGIGVPVARLFCDAGYRVVLAARRAERLVDLQDELSEAGGEALAVPVDLAEAAGADLPHLVGVVSLLGRPLAALAEPGGQPALPRQGAAAGQRAEGRGAELR